jgi:hypothetical protein
VILPWTVLQPSALERRWRTAALLAASVICIALVSAALDSDSRHPMLLSVAIAGCIAVTLGTYLWPRTDERREVAIGRDGVVLLRPIADSADTGSALRPVFGAPWLITFKGGTIWLAIWPDSLPPDAFSRLWVSTRWSRPRALSPTNSKVQGQGCIAEK